MATTSPATMPKLHGRAFYESLGSPKVVLAPMVDQSEYAWRRLTRSFFPPDQQRALLAYTPMFHARLFADSPQYRAQMFQPLKGAIPSPPDPVWQTANNADPHLDGNPATDRPLFVQFCANDPDVLLEAARHVQPYCDAVDLNLGCPQGIARKGHYGAFLQEDQDLIFRLVNRLHTGLDIPVTAKMRVLDSREATLAYARNLLAAGASIITVHGRQRHQKGHATGLADWTAIRHLRNNLPPDTVIFANGNILQHADIARCLAATGADAVMCAEGNLHDPAIFTPPPTVASREYWIGRSGRGGWRMDAVMRRYLDIIHTEVLGEPAPERGPLFLPSDPIDAWADPPTPPAEDVEPPQKKRRRGGGDKGRVREPNLGALQPHLFDLLRPL
ncbi:FMN-linked oxidoreductase, partial [Trichodelitschia bisporula]